MLKAKKNLGIRATPERWERINGIAFARNTSIQKLVDEAIDAHLFGRGSKGRKTNHRSPAARRVDSRRVQEALLRAHQTVEELMRLLEAEHEIEIVARRA